MAAQSDVPATVGTYYFKLKLGGKEVAGFFTECTGLETTHHVVDWKSIDGQGKTAVRKFPGQTTWSNITLKRGVDAGKDLWEWRQSVIDGKMAEARKDCSITVSDWENKQIATYSFLQAWPCRYTAPGVSADGNEILVEEIEIAHEGFARDAGGGGAAAPAA